MQSLPRFPLYQRNILISFARRCSNNRLPTRGYCVGLKTLPSSQSHLPQNSFDVLWNSDVRQQKADRPFRVQMQSRMLVTTANTSSTETLSSNERSEKAEPKPAVILIGWLMCNPKHLKKVEDWYKSQGFDTLAFTPPPYATFVPKASAVCANKYIRTAKRVFKLEEQQRPVFIHCFSGQGSVVSYNMRRRMRLKSAKHSALTESYCGGIYDSAPYPLDETQAKRGLASVTYENPISRYLLYYPSAAIMSSIYRVLFPRLAKKIELQYHEELLVHEKVPQLYFTSRNDDICPPFDLEPVVLNKIKEEEEAGMKKHTRWICWDESHHVSHFLKRNEEYTGELKEFLAHAIKEWTGKRKRIAGS